MAVPPLVSIVLPIHNERGNLDPLFAEIAQAFNDVRYEIVAVDDGSGDGSLQEAERLARGDDRIQVLHLERRAGQSGALLVAIDHAVGEFVLTMDADGQNDPADGRRLLDAARSQGGTIAVVGYRANRADGWWRGLQSRVANACRNIITGDKVRDTGCSLRVSRRSAISRLPRFDGMHRFIPTLLRMTGEEVDEMEVRHRPRRYGTSKYGMWARLRAGLRDAFGVRWLRARAGAYRP